jgi:hypothetical protein
VIISIPSGAKIQTEDLQCFEFKPKTSRCFSTWILSVVVFHAKFCTNSNQGFMIYGFLNSNQRRASFVHVNIFCCGVICQVLYKFKLRIYGFLNSNQRLASVCACAWKPANFLVRFCFAGFPVLHDDTILMTYIISFDFPSSVMTRIKSRC